MQKILINGKSPNHFQDSPEKAEKLTSVLFVYSAPESTRFYSKLKWITAMTVIRDS